jgi:hypothetical protein
VVGLTIIAEGLANLPDLPGERLIFRQPWYRSGIGKIGEEGRHPIV